MDDQERAENGFDPGRVDRRLKLPATKSCEMCGWKMVRTGEWFVCTNRGCEREDRAA